MTHVNIGSGRMAAHGWLNIDASPVRRLQDFLGPLVPDPFPRSVRYADITRGLSIRPGSVSGVYASHVLEHMSLEDARAALQHIYLMLQPGSVLRLVVPDLAWRARHYLQLVERSDPGASEWFVSATGLGQRATPNNLFGHLRNILGKSAHKWMYDEAGMSRELALAGFEAIRKARRGDSSDAMFLEVEEADRFVSSRGDDECALEARKPLVILDAVQNR